MAVLLICLIPRLHLFALHNRTFGQQFSVTIALGFVVIDHANSLQKL